jgi:hypothetical protein
MLTPQPVPVAGGVLGSAAPQNLYVSNGQLVVNGDQLGYGYNDTIRIDVNGQGGVYVNLNGQTASYGYGQVLSIVVNTGAGSNSVYVLNEADGIPLAINDGGSDYVSIGSGGSVQGIRGTVSISNPYAYTDLVIDDSADTVSRLATVNDTYVTGLAPANIYFHYNDLSYLSIYGGSGGNTFYVLDTPSTYTGTNAGYTWIDSGAGIDTVNIFGTTGGLYVNGQGGHDYVYVGTNYTNLGYGSTTAIYGFVYAFNPAGSTSLVVDDSLDTVGRTASLTGSTLTGLSPGAIYWVPTASYSGGVTDLHIYGSAATSTYNVSDTPNAYFSTNLNTGAGNDTVNIAGTTGFFTTYNRGGYDSVYVGNGTLANIRGSVYASGAGSTYLYVQDVNDDTAHNATLSGNSLMGLSGGVIWWAPSATVMGGVTYLRIAGSAGSIFTVNDTPNFLYYTDLYVGVGSQVNINGTTGALNVNTGVGQQAVYVGNGTLASINGTVNVSGAGSIYLYIQDSNDTTSHSATLTGSSLTGLSRAAIRWVASSAAAGGVTFLDVQGSAADSTYYVTDTPNAYYVTSLDTGNGDDTVFITATTGSLYVNNRGGADTVVIGRQGPATSGGTVGAINSFVEVGGVGTVALIIDDSADTVGRSAVLSDNSLVGLAQAPIYYLGNVASLTIDGGGGDDTFTVAITPNIPVTLDAGAGNNTLVGVNASTYWDITGIDAGNVSGNVNFANVENLVGGTSVDTFWFEPGAQVASIDGGGAPAGTGDWLDYANYLGAVTVNLATGQATGVTGTVRNIQNVFGSQYGNTLTGNAQGNVLVGGDGADTIIGGSGRSILIGGRGDDTIIGGAGDDVVIGGSTTLGSAWHESALMAALAEWQSSDSYATRVSILRSGYHAIAPTVSDDGGADTLTGGAGQDWFFVGTNGTVTDRLAGEAIN